MKLLLYVSISCMTCFIFALDWQTLRGAQASSSILWPPPGFFLHINAFVCHTQSCNKDPFAKGIQNEVV